MPLEQPSKCIRNGANYEQMCQAMKYMCIPPLFQWHLMLKFACSMVLISTVQPYRFWKTNKFKYSLNTFPFQHTTTSINDGNGAERKHSFENLVLRISSGKHSRGLSQCR